MTGVLKPVFGQRHFPPPAQATAGTPPASPSASPLLAPAAEIAQLRELCLARLDPSAVTLLPPDRLNAEVEHLIGEIATDRRIELNGREQHELAEELVYDMLGLGPLEPLLDDDSITDIMVNGPDRVFVERKRQGRSVRRTLPRRACIWPASASASPARSAGAWTNPARWWMRG